MKGAGGSDSDYELDEPANPGCLNQRERTSADFTLRLPVAMSNTIDRATCAWSRKKCQISCFDFETFREMANPRCKEARNEMSFRPVQSKIIPV